MRYLITTTRHFSAAHALRLYDQSMEPIHGHNWKIQVTVEAPRLDSIGVVMDFHDLEKQIDALVGPFHNRHLNELDAFQSLNPTAENVAVYVAGNLQLPAGAGLKSVEVWETPDNSARVEM